MIPVKRLPDGWVFRDELLAPWSTSLPAVLTIVPDTTVEVVYTDESRTTKDGIVLPIKRATVEFNYVTRLTIERITLGFVNIDYVYSTTNNSDSHYILESVIKKIKLKDNTPLKFLNTSARNIKFKKKLKYYKKYIVNYDNLKVNENMKSAIVTPDKDIIKNAENLSPAFIVFNNYELVLKWNRSLRFAIAVCTLKDNFKNEF